MHCFSMCSDVNISFSARKYLTGSHIYGDFSHNFDVCFSENYLLKCLNTSFAMTSWTNTCISQGFMEISSDNYFQEHTKNKGGEVPIFFTIIDFYISLCSCWFDPLKVN